MSNTPAGKSRKLGKGLSALMQPKVPAEVSVPVPLEGPRAEEAGDQVGQGGQGVLMLPVKSLVRSPYQPRLWFDEEEMNKLAQSIRAAGVIQPILVRTSQQNPSKYELMAGERRWQAAQMIGLETIPALVRELSDSDAAQLALVENLQRVDLDPMERAHALRRLHVEFGLTQVELAERIGLERTSVVNLIRVTELEDSIQGFIGRSELSIGHGKVLLMLAPGERRVRIAARAAKNKWSVRELERHLQDGAEGIGPFGGGKPSTTNSPTLSSLERQLGEHLGTRVQIKASKNGTKGKLVVDFYSLDHFDGLMGKMGFEGEG
ncbi:MAG: ParB/RepB/Spo0J family partition protein [Phycisphaeraceae bacterium]|nr:ParB/RepB/Spo0J family partition protein [Phycisphaeraceae bacterium]MCW5761607.1 ParB/RepB/Spo0J family partition protein [Phycisphaeraceae bacterium]